MKKLVYLSFLALFAMALPAFAEQPAVPTEPIMMNKTSKIVKFDHATHTKFECVECHHPVNNVATYQPCSTSGCHDKFGQKEKGVDSYYQIAHKMKGGQYSSCISCHLKESTPETKKFLTTCVKSACHP